MAGYDGEGNQAQAIDASRYTEAKVAERESPLTTAEKQLTETGVLLDMVVTRLHERLEPVTGPGSPYPDGSEKASNDVDSRSPHIRSLAGINVGIRESAARLERLLDRLEV